MPDEHAAVPPEADSKQMPVGRRHGRAGAGELISLRHPTGMRDMDRHSEKTQSPHVCIRCSSDLVYPLEWEESGPENWHVLLHCPNCDVHRADVFSQQTIEAFDDALTRGVDALTRDYKRLVRANMTGEIERFVGALNADAILPEDF